MKKTAITFLLTFLMALPLASQTIAEKKAGASQGGSDLNQEMQRFLIQVNKELTESQAELRRLYAQVQKLYDQNAPEESYRDLLTEIHKVKNSMEGLENSWREMATQGFSEENYALWHQPEATLGQLIMDYASLDYIYLLTPEIASIKISVDSNLPIPRASWNEMIELILSQNGVGIVQLNPFLRQLYLYDQDKSHLRLITNKRQDLEVLPQDVRVCFVLSPEPIDVRRIWLFLEKFINPNTTVMQKVGRDILIIASVGEVKDLLKLYDFVSTNRGDKEYRIIGLRKTNAEEMAKILSAIFDQMIESPSGSERLDRQGRFPSPPRTDNRQQNRKMPPFQRQTDKQENYDTSGLKIIALTHIAQALFLVGTMEEIRKAQDIVYQVESTVGEAREKVIFWYTTKHADPDELAALLDKIYTLMITTGAGMEKREQPPGSIPPPPPPIPPEIGLNQRQMGYLGQPYPPINVFDDGYYLNDNHIVDDFTDRNQDTIPNQNRNNFIIDPKTGAIVMVVEADILPKLKELIHKLDIPQKMVQLEVLLFEKRISHENNIGLNLLKIGSSASNTHQTGLNFNNVTLETPLDFGITTFFMSRMRTDSGIPAFDLIYKFLLSQQDVTINASPSVLAINQTTARITIEDEISVNTGVFEIPATGSVALKNAYARARYGTKIEITPTIHMSQDPFDPDSDGENYVTMVTDVIFETIHAGSDPQRPDVTRRTVQNQVCIPDGQTVFIGGLRRKNMDDSKESIPFLGELPGVGKLFSITTMEDDSTEMFIFITPKIIVDPAEDLDRLRCEELMKRPGDVPSFLCELVEAREMERNRLLAGTMQLLFGREPERCIVPAGEYDGR